MKTNTPSDQLPRALRNHAILGWWTDCSIGFRLKVCEEYASHIGCPLDEIDFDMTLPDDLDWLWTRFNATINLWVCESL